MYVRVCKYIYAQIYICNLKVISDEEKSMKRMDHCLFNALQKSAWVAVT